MKSIFFIFFPILFLGSSIIRAQALDTSITRGGSGEDRAMSIALDDLGNIIQGGWFRNTIIFDSSNTSFNLNSLGGSDGVVAKFNIYDSLLWAIRIGGSGDQDRVTGVTTDAQNNVYAIGDFKGNASFDLNPINNANSNGGLDVFVVKYSPQGNLLWIKTFGGLGDDRARKILISSSGKVLIAGAFRSTVDFDPSNTIVNRTSNGYLDGFLLQLNSNGNFEWVYTMGSNRNNLDLITGIDEDQSGNLICGGTFSGTVDFDPSSSINNKSAIGAEDAFLLKLDRNGNFIWVKNWGGSGYDAITDLIIDEGNIYTAGLFYNGVDFNPSSGIAFYNSNGSRDMFLSSIDTSGSFNWAITMGGISADVINGVAVNTNGDINVTGYFYNTSVDFDPSSANYTLTNSGSADAFIAQYSSTGNFNWTNKIGGLGEEVGYKLVARNNKLYATGFFSNRVDFDPSPIHSQFSNSNGDRDFYYVVFDDCNETKDTLFIQACNSYTSPSGTYIWTANGTYFDTLMNQAGCDSILMINLFINNSFEQIDTTTCKAYVSPSGRYSWNTTGTYQDTIYKPLSCDSVFTINLTRVTVDTFFNVVACRQFISPSGKYLWTNSGPYSDTVSNGQGCDSILNINLFIQQPNTTVSRNDPTLISNEVGATYQWLDCNSNNARIPNATNRIFTASSNGSYAVEITKNNCVDTSSCFNIINVGLSDVSEKQNIEIFPNPFEDHFNLSITGFKGTLSYDLISINGQTVESASISQGTRSITTLGSKLAEGIYLLRIFDQGSLVTYRKITKL